MSPSPDSRHPASRPERPLRCPWWLCVLLAGASYLAVCVISRSSGMLPFAGSRGAPTAAQTLAQSVTQAGLVLLPLGCLLLALMARRRDRLRPLNPPAAAPASDLGGMGWSDIIGLVTRVFSEMDYSVTARGQPGDVASLRLRREEHTFIVQCGPWSEPLVDDTAVQALLDSVAREGVTGGFLVTTGRFTPEAQVRARQQHVGLIDGARINAMVERMQPDHSSGPPACPLCGGPMTLGLHSAGPSAGMPAWNCVNFPSCWGARALE